jgi:DNA replication protein DnaC
MKQLSESQKTKLSSIISSCSLCGGMGAKDLGNNIFQRCSCSLQVQELIKLYQANIPEKFINMSLNDYTLGEEKLILNYINNLSTWCSRGAGLYLYGQNGVGKSFFMAMIAKESIRLGKTTYFCSLEQFLKIIIESKDKENLKDELEYIRDCDMLCIDEIEKVYKPSKEYSFADIIFDDLFRSRSNNKKIICCTSNLPQEDLKNIHGKHLVSLFSENMIPVLLTNTDFRKHIASYLLEMLENNK